MRIVHVYKDYAPVIGGIENHIVALAEAQAGQGHDVTVLVCAQGHGPSLRLRHAVRVICASRFATIASTPLSFDLALRLWSLDADIVHLHSPYPVGEAAWLLWPRPPATVVTHHCDVVRQRRLKHLYRPLRQRLLARADVVIVTHPAALSDPALASAARPRVVPLGIDAGSFHPPAASPPAAARRLLFVGKLRHYKGIDVLLRALVDVPQASLDIVGDGPFKARWRGLTDELGLGARVTFFGELDDAALRARYRDSTIFVLPSTSRAEAFGTVLLEAMAAGLPCVSTELGTGTSWVNQQGETGLVVPSGDAVALAAALRRLLDDADMRGAMADAARRRAVEVFSVSRMVAGVADAYELARQARSLRA